MNKSAPKDECFDMDGALRTTRALESTLCATGRSLEPGESFDGLVPVSFLGKGATCEVWRVADKTLKSDFALKILADDTNEMLQKRFCDEARILAQFNHPNIVRVHKTGFVRGNPYYVMDLLRPLPEKLSKKEFYRIAEGLFAALACLHDAGVVHRDVKGANLLLNAKGDAVLTDLGIAGIGNSPLAHIVRERGEHNPTIAAGGMALGTPGYAAPEQLTGGEIDSSADLHAAGVLINEIYPGKKPLLLKYMILRLVASKAAMRLKSAKRCAGMLRLVHLWETARWAILAFLICFAVLFAVLPSRVKWEALPEYAVRIDPVAGTWTSRYTIELPENAHYRDPGIVHYTSKYWLHGENPSSDAPHYRRHKVFISGEGVLWLEKLQGCEAHIGKNVKLVTSGTIDDDARDASENFPLFYLEKGAKLQFTDTDSYPQELVKDERAK